MNNLALLFRLLPLVAILGSCVVDDTVLSSESPADSNDLVSCSFTAMVVDSCTVSRGSSSADLVLFYQVFDALTGERLDFSRGYSTAGQVHMSDSLTATVCLDLPAGGAYRVGFWAQDRASRVFDTSDLRRVRADYSRLTLGDNCRHVYCGAVTCVPDTEASVQSVVLHSPLAGLHVMTTDKDTQDALSIDVNLWTMTSSLSLTGIGTQYDVLAGQVTEICTDPVSLGVGDIPLLPVTVGDTTFRTLASVYVLPSLTRQAGVSLSLHFDDADRQPLVFDIGFVRLAAGYDTYIGDKYIARPIVFTPSVEGWVDQTVYMAP